MAEDAGAAVAPHAQVPQPFVEQEDRQVRAEALAEERIQTTVKDMLSEGGMEQVSLRGFSKIAGSQTGSPQQQLHKGMCAEVPGWHGAGKLAKD